MEIEDIREKKFGRRIMGFDPDDVENFLGEIAEELRKRKEENEGLKKDMLSLEAEIKEHRDRERTIRAVLISAQKSAEQIKANAEREAKLVISEAEVKAEGILNDAGNRLAKIESDISEIRRNRIQFGARMRALLDGFRQMLDEEGKEAPRKFEQQDQPENT